MNMSGNWLEDKVEKRVETETQAIIRFDLIMRLYAVYEHGRLDDF